MSLIKLPCFGMEINLEGPPENLWGNIVSDTDLYETCPCCNQSHCHFDCDESQMEDSPESEEDAVGRLTYNSAVDGIESMILAHACAGLDVTTPAYIEGIETAINAAVENS